MHHLQQLNESKRRMIRQQEEEYNRAMQNVKGKKKKNQENFSKTSNEP